MHHTVHRRTRRERRRERPGSHGVSRDYCTQDSLLSLWVLLSTSLVPETRVSKRQHCGWWVRRSSWRGWRAVCYVLCSVYSPSLAAGGDPTTRRTEDCPVAWKARRCRWRVVRVGGRARHSAPPHGVSMRPPATCPASPAARRTSASADTAQPTRRYSRKLCLFSQRDHIQRRHRRCNRPQRAPGGLRGPRWLRGARAARDLQGASFLPRATCPSRAPPTANLCSAPRSCANKAINNSAILFYTCVNTDRFADLHV